VPTVQEAKAAGNTSDGDLEQQQLGDSAGGDSHPDVSLPDVTLADVTGPEGLVECSDGQG